MDHSPNRGEHKKYLKPPTRTTFEIPWFLGYFVSSFWIFATCHHFIQAFSGHLWCRKPNGASWGLEVQKSPTKNPFGPGKNPFLQSHQDEYIHIPGPPNVLFFWATLPLKPATIALKIGHLAFQVTWISLIFDRFSCIGKYTAFVPWIPTVGKEGSLLGKRNTTTTARHKKNLQRLRSL